MITYIIILGVVVTISIITIIFLTIRAKYKLYSIKVEEAENNIEALLNQKKALLYSANDMLNKLNEEETLTTLEKINEIEISTFKFSELLNDSVNEFNNIIEGKKAFIPDEGDTDLINDMSLNSMNCEACERYYNCNAEELNKLLHSFPTNLIGKLSGYKEKGLYTWKKEEIFEILKN